MKVLHAEASRTVFEKSVHYLHCTEQRFFLGVELVEHVGHPVDHARPDLPADAVFVQEIFHVKERICLDGLEVLLNKVGKVADAHVL